jgi:lipoprotein-anchoring transpeptidase ErfK/SrfK
MSPIRRRLSLLATLLATVPGAATATPDGTVYPPVTVPDKPIPGSRQERFTLVADIANPKATRLYIFDTKKKVYVDRYLISPGIAKYPTKGNSFVIDRAVILPTWTPPPGADWAKNLKFQPGGINNPMGVLKLSLGAYGQYIHGIPKTEEAFLGTAASHGCLRMSSANVLQLYQRYAGIGTKVTINRDLAKSKQWASDYAGRSGKDHPITDGAELIANALKKIYPPVLEYHDDPTAPEAAAAATPQ